MIALLLLALDVARAAQATTVVKNTVDWPLIFNAVNLILGSFVVYPPQKIAANDTGTWANYGAFDAIGYAVYYESAVWSAGECVRFDYSWDLVTAACDAVFVPCPTKKRAASSVAGCKAWVSWDCSGLLGDPTFLVYNNCTRKSK